MESVCSVAVTPGRRRSDLFFFTFILTHKKQLKYDLTILLLGSVGRCIQNIHNDIFYDAIKLMFSKYFIIKYIKKKHFVNVIYLCEYSVNVNTTVFLTPINSCYVTIDGIFLVKMFFISCEVRSFMPSVLGLKKLDRCIPTLNQFNFDK